MNLSYFNEIYLRDNYILIIFCFDFKWIKNIFYVDIVQKDSVLLNLIMDEFVMFVLCLK